MDEEKEEGTDDLPMTGITEPTVTEDPMVMMKEIFEDLHAEGQTSMASPEAAEGEGIET